MNMMSIGLEKSKEMLIMNEYMHNGANIDSNGNFEPKNKTEPKLKSTYINSRNKILEDYYKDKLKKDITQSDSYSNYGLLDIASTMQLHQLQIGKCYYGQVCVNGCDNGIAYIRLDDNIYFEILNTIDNLRKNGQIKKISILPDEYYCVSNYHWISLSLEEKAYGKHFELSNLGSSSKLITKLYNNDLQDGNCFQDFLWVKVEQNQITFEEMLSQQPFDDIKITQVIHLRYFCEATKYYIEHIDHEFIFYRMKNLKKDKEKNEIKGRKQKTLKIDNSCIPLTLDNNEDFLYKFLDNYFERKDLIAEYFQKVMNKN